MSQKEEEIWIRMKSRLTGFMREYLPEPSIGILELTYKYIKMSTKRFCVNKSRKAVTMSKLRIHIDPKSLKEKPKDKDWGVICSRLLQEK